MIVLFNKPFGVVCQFSKHEIHPKIQYEISSPNNLKYKGYWVQVEGDIDNEAIQKLQNGISLKDYVTMPAKAEKIQEPEIWQRSTPIRFRKDIPTSWVKLQIMEGKNRQVRRMTAAVGFPTLRLIRYHVDEYYLNKLLPGDYQIIK
ncbi:MAG: 23S rRNA pseudouridylate synthase [Betaproteobacteria bacterium]|nr:23S rRNA pseudouridylate synthase [Betaproteobacteria bacterium]